MPSCPGELHCERLSHCEQPKHCGAQSPLAIPMLGARPPASATNGLAYERLPARNLSRGALRCIRGEIKYCVAD